MLCIVSPLTSDTISLTNSYVNDHNVIIIVTMAIIIQKNSILIIEIVFLSQMGCFGTACNSSLNPGSGRPQIFKSRPNHPGQTDSRGSRTYFSLSTGDHSYVTYYTYIFTPNNNNSC